MQVFNPNDPNVAMLERVVRCLGPELCSQLVFVGGAAAGLLITDLAMPAIRRTDDVDIVISAEALAAEQPGSFDVVTCMEMLEHVPDPAAVVKACADLVKPGGWVFFSTLNRNPKSFLFAIVGAEYLLKLLPKGTHEYARLIKPSELSQWARDAGLDLQGFKGMEYNPFTRRYWLSQDTSVNYLLACRKPA